VHDNGPDDHEHDAPPGAAVTVYPVMAEPPSPAGADHDTDDSASPAVARTPSGGPGKLGVTGPAGADGALGPTPFVAVTVNV
jgi:hypothetical protein